MFQRLWRDDAGFVVSAELVLVATVLVIGMTVGIVTVRDQVIQELADIAAAVSSLNMSYSFSGITGHTSSSAGSVFDDNIDLCDGVFANDLAGQAPMCIEMVVLASPES